MDIVMLKAANSKGYSGVSLIYGITHHETVLESLLRDQISRPLIYEVLSTSEKDRTITIHCSIRLQQETAIKKPQIMLRTAPNQQYK